LYGISAVAVHSLPCFVIWTPLIQAPGAKSPRTSTEVSPLSGYVNRCAQSLSASSHWGGPLPPSPPVPVPVLELDPFRPPSPGS
jgi:hypothetical protein